MCKGKIWIVSADFRSDSIIGSVVRFLEHVAGEVFVDFAMVKDWRVNKSNSFHAILSSAT